MRTVIVTQTFPGSVHDAETCWYDTARWHLWVDGLDRVVELTGEWPRQGATVVWESGPAGRGRVTERVVEHEPLVGQSVDVRDESIRGRQRVTFTPMGHEVRIALSLEYQITKRSLATGLIDLLFIRRVMATSLNGTLTRFGAELAAMVAGRGR